MSTEPDTQHEQRESNPSDRAIPATAVNMPVKLGAAAGSAEGYEELETPTAKESAQNRRLPHLSDYNFHISRPVFVIAFFLSAIRQGFCNYMTASGIAAENNTALYATVKAVSTCFVIGGAFWVFFLVLGPWRRLGLTFFFGAWSTMCYGVAFAVIPTAASLTQLPNVVLAFLVGLPRSNRRCFTITYMTLAPLVQVILTFIINALPLVQSNLPEAAQPFLVPALKTVYQGFVAEVLTAVWKKMYRRPCPPVALTSLLLIALVSAETMGVVGLLAAVDSANPWTSAANFCVTTIVMETMSRSGILLSLVFRMFGKKYRFSDAAHIFRWAKMWASYCWVCVFTGFVVPALILGLRVKDSNFTFLRWEPWALLGIYVLQQMMTDAIYVCVQHYIRPSPSLSQTAARCLLLGEATPLSRENEHVVPLEAKAAAAEQSPKGAAGGRSGAEEEAEAFEEASLSLGSWTITKEAIVAFLLFEYTVSVWNNYVRGQFCIYGTFLPSADGDCE